MREVFQNMFKCYFRSQLLQVRGSALTQEQTAAALNMSVRAYAALESGESCCGVVTLLLFLRYLCPDRDAFLDELFREWEQAEGKER